MSVTLSQSGRLLGQSPVVRTHTNRALATRRTTATFRRATATTGYDASDAIRLERKDDMRRRGLASPDDGDALTFAYPVARRDWAEERRFEEGLQKLKRWIV